MPYRNNFDEKYELDTLLLLYYYKNIEKTIKVLKKEKGAKS